MTTLADKAILSGADNHLPMLKKDMYDSWKIIMELYMLNRQNGRMILEFVESGPLIWPSIVEYGVTKPKKYSEISATKALQADCDIKATNIILQGLRPEVYALVSNHKVAKELWERIQLLMQGTSLTKQERECKLYDEFDKFAYKKGESLREFYLRFSLLLNDMNIYNMKLEQFQVNTKFLNTLPPEWSKFVTDVKLVRDLHTTNIDQLHAYLGQHEFHANEVRLMHERNSDPLALVATHQMTQSPYQTHQNSHQNTQFQPQVSSYQSPQYGSPYQSQQYSTHQSSTPLSITYPSNDYQSSIHHNIYSPSSSIPQLEYPPSVDQQSEFSQQESGLIVPVFQKGDDLIDAINHMMSFLTAVVTSRYPTTNNQLRNSSNPRQQATINNGRAMPSSKQSNVVNHSETEITSDSNIIPYSQYLIESQQVVVQNSNSSVQQDDLILSVIEQLKTQVIHCTKTNLENKSVNDTLTAELEKYKEQVKVLKEGQNVDLRSKDNVSHTCAQSVEIDLLKQTLSEHLKEKEYLLQMKARQSKPKLYVGDIIIQTNPIVIPDSEETLALAEESRSKMLLKHKYNMMLEKEKQVDTTPIDYVALNQLYKDFSTRFVPQTKLSAEQAFWSQNSVNFSEPTLSIRPTNVEVPKELPKVSMFNTSLKKLKHHLANFDVVVKERTQPTVSLKLYRGGFEHIKAYFRDEIIPFVKALKDLFSTFNQHLVDELFEVQNVFYQMEQTVEQHRIESKTFEVKMNQVLNNKRLLEKLWSKSYCELHKAQSQEKDTVIKKLKERIKSLSGNMDKDKIKQDLEEIETINIELDHKVTKLIAKNEHLKQTYKQLYDSTLNQHWVKKALTITTLKDELRKLKGKALVDNNVSNHPSDPELHQEEAAVLRDLVDHIKANYPLDPLLESTYKYTKLIQEMLSKISKTCPSIQRSGEQLVAVTPMNKVIKIKQSTSASGSQPSGNTKKDKIQQTQSRILKNKVEAHPRKVKSSLKNKDHVVEPKGTAPVQHSKLNANSDLKCVKCNGCMLSDNLDLCVLDFINNVNARAKSRSRPAGWTFTIVGNACPLTRITTTTKVPLRKSSALDNKTPKPVVTLVYSRKPRKSKTSVIVNNIVITSVTANNSEHQSITGSIVLNVPPNLPLLMNAGSSKLSSVCIWTPEVQAYVRRSLSAHQFRQ
ncbi:hypothetical protein Tco_0237041 [Tanacetum coccineum]